MKKKRVNVLTVALIIILLIGNHSVLAKDSKDFKILNGKVYESGEKDEYDLSKAKPIDESASCFYIEGAISEVSKKSGFPSYAVKSGNLKISVDTDYLKTIANPADETGWHIIKDKTKTVDSTKLSESIGRGAIILQTSKDGEVWYNATTETDICEKIDTINKRFVNGEEIDSFYKTTNLQLTMGCYYRIIVAYKLERNIDPKKILFVPVDKTEEIDRIEVYQFYAYNPSVDRNEKLDSENATQYSTVYRVDSPDGFSNEKTIASGDPHINWVVGKFYINGYTTFRPDSEPRVFFKNPEDRISLWFNLKNSINQCNGQTDIKVFDTPSGSDNDFGTPRINNWGHGTLIIRKTDCNYNQERYIYTNFLEAVASTDANTRIDLFEEGDYEVSLDYQLQYDKPFVFGKTTKKVLSYKVPFSFKVRNGDLSMFLRDAYTGKFLSNASVAERGFYIDLAGSKYLELSIKREVMSDSFDGLIEDTEFVGVATEGRTYDDEGIYTVTVNNPATGNSFEQRVYVGDRDVLRAHMATGLSINEINGLLASGHYIDKYGHIVSVSQSNDIDEYDSEAEPVLNETVEGIDNTNENQQSVISDDSAAPEPLTVNEDPATSDTVDSQTSGGEESSASGRSFGAFGVVAAIMVIAGACLFGLKKKKQDGGNVR